MPVVMTFASIHEALRAESAARRLGIVTPGQDAGLIPLPPQLSSDCGFGLLIDGADPDTCAAVRALRGEGIAIREIYGRKENGYERIDHAG
jgi:hypothetical protein